jgi:crotonobetainyl-CoA:carnitine CoA-transferase CaiB-like acyl-CoA transferase
VQDTPAHLPGKVWFVGAGPGSADLLTVRAIRLLARADVVLQNLRPGQVEELGLDATTLRGLKPALVYCNMGAFGAKGPLAERPGYDPLMQAFGGVGVVATTPAELGAAMREAVASGKPTLINAIIDETAGTESGRITMLNPQTAKK